jgi:hypothetical protein
MENAANAQPTTDKPISPKQPGTQILAILIAAIVRHSKS